MVERPPFFRIAYIFITICLLLSCYFCHLYNESFVAASFVPASIGLFVAVTGGWIGEGEADANKYKIYSPYG